MHWSFITSNIQEGVTAMEVAKLILEYLKVIAWPLMVLFLVLRFRASIVRILNAVGDRLASAETVKVGVFGQEVEISGTAKELQVVRQELLATSSGDQDAQERAGRILQAIPQLNNPIADIVGVALLNAPRNGFAVDDLLETVLNALSPKRDRERFRAEHAQFVLLSMAREVEKVLAQLVELDFARAEGERYALTSAGRDFFKKVAARQRHLLSRFATRMSGS
jgi:hypothetical protein